MEKLTDMKEVSRIARSFMRKWDSGVLSTQYETEGSDYPFGTLCPFVITEEGDIVVLISNIAVHTKNVKANHRVGFTVFDLEASHKQAAPRVCLVGDAEIVDVSISIPAYVYYIVKVQVSHSSFYPTTSTMPGVNSYALFS